MGEGHGYSETESPLKHFPDKKNKYFAHARLDLGAVSLSAGNLRA